MAIVGGNSRKQTFERGFRLYSANDDDARRLSLYLDLISFVEVGLPGNAFRNPDTGAVSPFGNGSRRERFHVGRFVFEYIQLYIPGQTVNQGEQFESTTSR